jgi:hypothetical protein
MPLIRIDMSNDIDGKLQALISDAINGGLVEAIDMPAKDRFQIFTRHPVEDLVLLDVSRRCKAGEDYLPTGPAFPRTK